MRACVKCAGARAESKATNNDDLICMEYGIVYVQYVKYIAASGARACIECACVYARLDNYGLRLMKACGGGGNSGLMVNVRAKLILIVRHCGGRTGHNRSGESQTNAAKTALSGTLLFVSVPSTSPKPNTSRHFVVSVSRFNTITPKPSDVRNPFQSNIIN